MTDGCARSEPGLTRAAEITLKWETFTEAADETGLSRRYWGIHFLDGDMQGRAMGRQIGTEVWKAAEAFFNGTAVPKQ